MGLRIRLSSILAIIVAVASGCEKVGGLPPTGTSSEPAPPPLDGQALRQALLSSKEVQITSARQTFLGHDFRLGTDGSWFWTGSDDGSDACGSVRLRYSHRALDRWIYRPRQKCSESDRDLRVVEIHLSQ